MGTSRQYIIGGTPEALGEKAKPISLVVVVRPTIFVALAMLKRETRRPGLAQKE